MERKGVWEGATTSQLHRKRDNVYYKKSQEAPVCIVTQFCSFLRTIFMERKEYGKTCKLHRKEDNVYYDISVKLRSAFFTAYYITHSDTSCELYLGNGKGNEKALRLINFIISQILFTQISQSSASLHFNCIYPPTFELYLPNGKENTGRRSQLSHWQDKANLQISKKEETVCVIINCSLAKSPHLELSRGKEIGRPFRLDLRKLFQYQENVILEISKKS